MRVKRGISMKNKFFTKMCVAAAVMVLSTVMLVGCGNDTQRSSDEVITEEESQPDVEGMVHLGSSDDVNDFIDEVYGAVSSDILPQSLTTSELGLDDADTIEYHTGLVDLDGIEGVYLSEPMMSSVAYSAIYVRTNDDADGNASGMARAIAIRDAIMENVDPSKWVCVTAEKQSAVILGNDVFFVMGAPETVDAVMENVINSANARNMSVSDTVEKTNPL
jgi:hypothetical protein